MPLRRVAEIDRERPVEHDEDLLLPVVLVPLAARPGRIAPDVRPRLRERIVRASPTVRGSPSSPLHPFELGLTEDREAHGRSIAESLLRGSRSDDDLGSMPKPYRLSRWRRALNALVRPLAKLGLTGPRTHLLTVPGRKTGRLWSTPVSIVKDGETRWLVAPYGDRNWVKNARAAGWWSFGAAAVASASPSRSSRRPRRCPSLREYYRARARDTRPSSGLAPIARTRSGSPKPRSSLQCSC